MKMESVYYYYYYLFENFWKWVLTIFKQHPQFFQNHIHLSRRPFVPSLSVNTYWGQYVLPLHSLRCDLPLEHDWPIRDNILKENRLSCFQWLAADPELGVGLGVHLPSPCGDLVGTELAWGVPVLLYLMWVNGCSCSPVSEGCCSHHFWLFLCYLPLFWKYLSALGEGGVVYWLHLGLSNLQPLFLYTLASVGHCGHHHLQQIATFSEEGSDICFDLHFSDCQRCWPDFYVFVGPLFYFSY